MSEFVELRHCLGNVRTDLFYFILWMENLSVFLPLRFRAAGSMYVQNYFLNKIFHGSLPGGYQKKGITGLIKSTNSQNFTIATNIVTKLTEA